MIQFKETFFQVLRYIRQYKLRTFMTMFGLIWGTMTVILLLAFGVGLKKAMSKNMHGMGDGIAIMWPGSTSIPYNVMDVIVVFDFTQMTFLFYVVKYRKLNISARNTVNGGYLFGLAIKSTRPVLPV